MDLHQQLEASQNRRMAAEHRFLVRREKLEKAAEPWEDQGKQEPR